MKKRDIILVELPFTDLSERKIRPALILAKIKDDLLCCFISSNVQNKNKNDILIKKDKKNQLKVDSLIKCGKLFTIHSSLVNRSLGNIDKVTYQLVVKTLTELIN